MHCHMQHFRQLSFFLDKPDSKRELGMIFLPIGIHLMQLTRPSWPNKVETIWAACTGDLSVRGYQVWVHLLRFERHDLLQCL